MFNATAVSRASGAIAEAQAAWFAFFEEWAQIAFTFEPGDPTPRLRGLFTAGARAHQAGLNLFAAAIGAPAPEELRPAPSQALQPPKKANGFQALKKSLGRRDDLTRIKGLGPRMQDKLNALGVFHFWQLASLSAAAAEALDERLGANGRVKRDRWVAQARKLTEEAPA